MRTKDVQSAVQTAVGDTTVNETRCMFWSKGIKDIVGGFLVAQWLRIRLPMRGTQVRALVREDPTCRRATKPVRHNY